MRGTMSRRPISFIPRSSFPVQRRWSPNFLGKQNRARKTDAVRYRLRPLLVLFFGSAALLCSSRLLFFFHLLADFFLPLGSHFSPLGALGFNHLLAAQQFDEARLRSIAGAPAFVDNAHVAAIAVAKSRRNVVKQTLHGLARHEIPGGQSSGGHVAPLAQRDHLFHMLPHGLGFGGCRLNPLFHNERCHQVAQQRAPVACISSEFLYCSTMTHDVKSLAIFPFFRSY